MTPWIPFIPMGASTSLLRPTVWHRSAPLPTPVRTESQAGSLTGKRCEKPIEKLVKSWKKRNRHGTTSIVGISREKLMEKWMSFFTSWFIMQTHASKSFQNGRPLAKGCLNHFGVRLALPGSHPAFSSLAMAQHPRLLSRRECL